MSIPANLPQQQGFTSEKALKFLRLSNTQFWSAVVIALVSNALLSTVIGSFEISPIYAVANTFEISAIVWFGLYIAIKFIWNMEPREFDRTGKAVGLTALVVCFVPLGPATWVFVSAVALFMIGRSSHWSTNQARGGWILLAISFPMFWSKRAFNLFSEFFLSLDASLVSSITNTERTGNLVAMPSGSGYLQIAAPCSSMANVSLALLCWVIFTQTSGIRWSPSNLIWCMAACLAVVAINVTRITLIGFFPQFYETLHGPIGNTAASWLSIIAMTAVCYLRSRYDRQS